MINIMEALQKKFNASISLMGFRDVVEEAMTLTGQGEGDILPTLIEGYRKQYKMNPLVRFAKSGCLDKQMVKYFAGYLDINERCEIPGESGKLTAIHFVLAKHKNILLAEYLCSLGARFDKGIYAYDYIMMSKDLGTPAEADSEGVNVFKWLLNKIKETGVNINKISGKQYWNDLMYDAFRNGTPEQVIYLVENGMDLFRQVKGGCDKKYIDYLPEDRWAKLRKMKEDGQFQTPVVAEVNNVE